jgi:hypothetical protein
MAAGKIAAVVTSWGVQFQNDVADAGVRPTPRNF